MTTGEGAASMASAGDARLSTTSRGGPTNGGRSLRSNPGRRGNTSRQADSEAGVSNVLGAILMFAIFILTLITVQTEYVPVWDEDREVRHMDRVFAQLAILKSDLDRQVDNRTDVPISDPVTLSIQGGLSFFRSESLPGSLALDSAAGVVSVYSPELTIQESGGRSFYGLADPNDWLDVDSSDDRLEGVTGIRALRVRINMNPGTAYDHGDSTTLVITDVNGATAGSATMTFLDFPSEQAIQTQTFNADGEEVSSDLEAFFQQTEVDFFYVDLLDPNLLFDAVFAAADGPLILELFDSGLDASYVVAYDAEASGGGTTTLGSAGLVVAPYGPVLYTSGTLTFDSRNQDFVDQSYVLEHGAVLRVQDDGAAIVIPPLLSFTDATTSTFVEWTLPALAGGSQQVAGPTSISVVADPTGTRTDLRASAYTLEFDIPTAYPDVWEDYLERILRDAGYAENVEYTAVADTDSVLLTLTGVDSVTDDHDLFLSFKQANIEITLEASG